MLQDDKLLVVPCICNSAQHLNNAIAATHPNKYGISFIIFIPFDDSYFHCVIRIPMYHKSIRINQLPLFLPKPTLSILLSLSSSIFVKFRKSFSTGTLIIQQQNNRRDHSNQAQGHASILSACAMLPVSCVIQLLHCRRDYFQLLHY